MFIKLLCIFVGVPALEIYTLLEFGRLIGIGATVALIILTGISGTYLARTQGLDLLKKIQNEMSQGRVPADELLNGLLVFAGGIVLLTPGFWTDLIGFCLLIPATRNMVRPWLHNWLAKKTTVISMNSRRNL